MEPLNNTSYKFLLNHKGLNQPSEQVVDCSYVDMLSFFTRPTSRIHYFPNKINELEPSFYFKDPEYNVTVYGTAVCKDYEALSELIGTIADTNNFIDTFTKRGATASIDEHASNLGLDAVPNNIVLFKKRG
jgi:hypothetical protein